MDPLQALSALTASASPASPTAPSISSGLSGTSFGQTLHFSEGATSAFVPTGAAPLEGPTTWGHMVQKMVLDVNQQQQVAANKVSDVLQGGPTPVHEAVVATETGWPFLHFFIRNPQQSGRVLSGNYADADVG